MTEIRFTRDYRGKLTQEYFWEAGSVGSFDHAAALQIIAEAAAELVGVAPVEPTTKTATPKRARRTKRK